MKLEVQEELRANREKVVFLVEHLRKAFEDYVNQEAEKGKEHEIGYTDALMGIHNFHKLIVQDIEERSGLTAEARQAYRRLWVDTFAIALLGSEEEKAQIRARNQS